jgi:O-antigen/teichoic acid export membrane protein
LSVLSAVALAAIHYRTSKSLLPDLLRVPPSRRSTRSLLRLGAGLTFVTGTGIVLANLERPALALVASISAVAQFSVASSVASLPLTVTVALSQPLLVQFSRLAAADDRARLRDLYARVSSGLLVLLPTSLLFLGASGPTLLQLWAGRQLGMDSAPAFFILVVGISVNILSFPPYQLLLATGRARVVAILSIAELPFYVCLLALLAHRFGAVGAALAWTMRATTEYLLLHRAARRFVGADTAYGWRNVVVVGLGGCMAAAPVGVAAMAGGSTFLILSLGVAASVTYGFLGWRWLRTTVWSGDLIGKP